MTDLDAAKRIARYVHAPIMAVPDEDLALIAELEERGLKTYQMAAAVRHYLREDRKKRRERGQRHAAA